ncbi:MAG: HNH endonuclease [Bacteroidetes bacterium]|nr:HNH endonuclease [Bacteroidota bacterium]
MKYTKEFLENLFDKTSGRCHLCGRGLCFKNFGSFGSREAWEIEHSNPKSRGGSDHFNNLFPAHITCNRSKSNNSTRSERAKHGRTRAPYSVQKREELIIENTFIGGGVGLLIGTLLRLANPGLALYTLGGLIIGNIIEPDE